MEFRGPRNVATKFMLNKCPNQFILSIFQYLGENKNFWNRQNVWKIGQTIRMVILGSIPIFSIITTNVITYRNTLFLMHFSAVQFIQIFKNSSKIQKSTSTIENLVPERFRHALSIDLNFFQIGVGQLRKFPHQTSCAKSFTVKKLRKVKRIMDLEDFHYINITQL